MKKGAGFTIIELLVVIAIVGIISSIMVVNFRKSEESNKLQRAAQQVVQGIRKAQNMALSSIEVPGKCPPEIICKYYGVYFNTQSMPNSYHIFASANKVYNPPGETVEIVNLEAGIVIDSVAPSEGNKLNIIFSPPHAFPVEFNPTTTQAVITVKKKDGVCSQDCRYIKINDKGWIAIQRTL